MLDKIKEVLRITTDDFDQEISDLIEACRSDLKLSGVSQTKINRDTDPLIKRAVSVYCKAHFGFDNPDFDKLTQSYDSIKKEMVISSEYTTEVSV
jgi:uncharacterized phage protein (predicted DNA packaging)